VVSLLQDGEVVMVATTHKNQQKLSQPARKLQTTVIPASQQLAMPGYTEAHWALLPAV
jgi:hypothetical protein